MKYLREELKTQNISLETTVEFSSDADEFRIKAERLLV